MSNSQVLIVTSTLHFGRVFLRAFYAITSKNNTIVRQEDNFQLGPKHIKINSKNVVILMKIWY